MDGSGRLASASLLSSFRSRAFALHLRGLVQLSYFQGRTHFALPFLAHAHTNESLRPGILTWSQRLTTHGVWVKAGMAFAGPESRPCRDIRGAGLKASPSALVWAFTCSLSNWQDVTGSSACRYSAEQQPCHHCQVSALRDGEPAMCDSGLLMMDCRCGNVAAILELDEHLSKNFKVGRHTPGTEQSIRHTCTRHDQTVPQVLPTIQSLGRGSEICVVCQTRSFPVTGSS